MPVRQLPKPKIMVLKAGSEVLPFSGCGHSFKEKQEQYIIVYLRVRHYYVGVFFKSSINYKVKKKDCRELTKEEIAQFNTGRLKSAGIKLNDQGEALGENS
ncbi:hypothetical protein KJ885_00475 [Patescibacteria group bacterium]|nr:hypothetical protein [Patescibacteria group bacterium]